MVKNESRIVHRLLNSVKAHVDGIVLCDTGSTDTTVELATQWLESNDVSGHVYQYPFVNFGVSRTDSFLKAQEWVASVGWPAADTWGLFLDGDMLLDAPIDRSALAAMSDYIAGVSLKQANGDLLYSNMRLLRCSEPWICKGATHEAWTCPPHKSTQLFDSPVLKDYGDGGCKSDKYPRDVRLLLEDISANPLEPRSHFYLGQTYIGMHAWQDAVTSLKRRIELGGWDEETYFAKVYLGEAYENLGDKANAAHTWLDAWQSRPHRTEAMMKLITMHRREPKSQMLGMMYLERLWVAQKGEGLDGSPAAPANPNNDLLFVNKRDMRVPFWEELGILAYYNGPVARRTAFFRIDEYDLTNTLGWHEFNAIFANMRWYDWTLTPRRSSRFSIPVGQLPWADEDQAGVWQPFNPSIRVAPDRKGYWLNLRYANYWTEEAKHYAYRGFHGKVLTRNCFLQVPQESGWNHPKSIEEITIDPAIPQADGYIQGVEDCRWIQNSGRQEFLGTSRSYSTNGSNKIMHVWRDPGSTTWSLRQMALPAGVSAEETQKNWLGFRKGGALMYLYGYSPLQVCAEDGSDVAVYRLSGSGTPFQLKEYRGSAGPAEWRSAAAPAERYLCVIHKVYIGGDGRRYYHRFLTLNEDFTPSRVSCFVRMTQERVEYWSGMCPSIEGDSYWITYGLKDSEAYIAEMTGAAIDKLLFYSFSGAVPTVPMAARLGLTIQSGL
jgi:glycosyltransferase involved in cell wall biosynthesis